MLRVPTHRPPTHPGEMLEEEFLKPLKLSQSELARQIGVSVVRVNELVRGKRAMSPDTALRLEKLLGMSAGFWMNLQLAWDLYHAMRAPDAETIATIERWPALAGAADHNVETVIYDVTGKSAGRARTEGHGKLRIAAKALRSPHTAKKGLTPRGSQGKGVR